jgi:glycosyltransferase involved in cell wall biosynthesis
LKILYIHQYFKTPSQGGAIRSYHVAKALIAAGHDVSMITTHHLPQKMVAMVEGIKVYYLPVPYQNSFGPLKRIWAFLSFLMQASRLAIQLKKDLVYATSTPLSVGIIALLNRWLCKTPYVFEVRDLWPKVPIAMGYVNKPLLIKALNFAEKLIYRNAAALIALSPGIEKAMKEVCQTVPLYMVPNFADTDFYKPQPRLSHDKITITYQGTLGVANGLDALLCLAQVAEAHYPARFQFNIMGDGAEKDKLMYQATNIMALSNVTFYPFANKNEAKELMQNSDIMYVSFARYPILGETTSPNKFFDALAMHKPIIVNFQGWLGDLLLAHKAGFYHDISCNEKALLAIIIDRHQNALEWTNMQKAAGVLAHDCFKMATQLSKIVAIVAGFAVK